MEIGSLRDLFVHELRGTYHMERRLVEILDEMTANTTDDQISTEFAVHREETEDHATRVRDALQAMDLTPEERECPIVEALDQEHRTIEESVQDEDLLNLFYLGTGMKTEVIELTTYDSLLMMAERLDLGDDVTGPLEKNLASEDNTLTRLQTLSTASDLETLWEKFLP